MVARAERLTALCVAAPAILVAVVFGASGATTLVTGQPLVWGPEEITLSEAVALRDRGEVARQIMLGTDPNRRYDVRGVLRENEHVALTPLEAAVITREGYMLSLVLQYGANINDQNAATLQCLAKHLGNESIGRYVADLSREADCSGVELPWSLDRMAGSPRS